jgi:hypothetical protein
MDDDELVRLISARCPELSELELGKLSSALAGKTITPLTGEQAERLVEAVDALETRLARMVADATAYREVAEAAAAFIDSAAAENVWH